MVLEFCKEMFVNDAPMDVAATEEKLKNKENILEDTKKLIKRVQCFTSVQNTVKITERSWQYQKRTSRKAETGRGR